MFKRKKHKYCSPKKLREYPCDVYLKNALSFISQGDNNDAYAEICWAILKSGGEWTDEQRKTFKRLSEVN